MISPADAPFGIPNILEFGVAGAALGGVLAVVVRPLLSSALRQQDRALDLLEKSVAASADAVGVFRSFERSQTETMARITQVQNEILHALVAMQERLVGMPKN